jgi:3-mercaptopyruvate sulfurtransferase SseA
MSFEIFKRISAKRVLALIMVGVFSLPFGGCTGDGGPNSYDEPIQFTSTAITGQRLNVLIDAATLKSWENYVNLQFGYQSNVVILDVSDSAGYLAGHIPGAQLWDINNQYMNRHEGVADGKNMVLDGGSMDAMIQTHGIDERTTVVLTSSLATASAPTAHVGRAYFLFRYWGWSKDKLKVLNGYNNGWTAAGYPLVTDVPQVDATDYSVVDNGVLNSSERASLAEMIAAVGDAAGNSIPLDLRGGTGAAGSTKMTLIAGGDTVDTADDVYSRSVFDGVMKNGQSYSFTNFRDASFFFNDAATIETALNGLGINSSNTVYTYCTTGVLASAGYFVLDGILGWDVQLYDGSFSQWGMMSDNTAKGGVLPADSPYITDTAALMDTINYNQDSGYTVEVLELNTDSSALDVEEEDAAYMQGSGGSADLGGTAPGYGG